jgi:type II secretory pathway component PulC
MLYCAPYNVVNSFVSGVGLDYRYILPTKTHKFMVTHLGERTLYLNQDLYQPIEKHAFIAMTFVIGLALISFGYQGYTFYQRIQELSHPVVEPLVQIAEPSPAEPPAIPMAEVASINLFGQFQEVVEPAPEPAPVLVNLPETTLQLTLNGAFTHSDDGKSSAIISAMENRSEYEGAAGGHYYFINDVLPGNAVLYAVHKDSVILKRGDIYETLHFPGYTRTIIDPTPRPQSMAGHVADHLLPPSTAGAIATNENSEALPATTSASGADHSDVRRSIQDRLARLRAQ